jgi:hypothetical protein
LGRLRFDLGVSPPSTKPSAFETRRFSFQHQNIGFHDPGKSGVLSGAAFTLGDKQSYPTTMMYPHHIMLVGMEVACHTQLARLSPERHATIQVASSSKHNLLPWHMHLRISKSIYG